MAEQLKAKQEAKAKRQAEAEANGIDISAPAEKVVEKAKPALSLADAIKAKGEAKARKLAEQEAIIAAGGTVEPDKPAAAPPPVAASENFADQLKNRLKKRTGKIF
jgi:hypothetical protein